MKLSDIETATSWMSDLWVRDQVRCYSRTNLVYFTRGVYSGKMYLYYNHARSGHVKGVPESIRIPFWEKRRFKAIAKEIWNNCLFLPEAGELHSAAAERQLEIFRDMGEKDRY